ncbi:hypothetical protein SESBI_31680 [Sesbania bispinosa]|nr:hypothetical protein SESBI_31680 [Sesbania bispinosa]
MAFSKTLITAILISLVILHLVESDTMVSKTMVEDPSPNPNLQPSIGVGYRQGERYVREHVERAVSVAIVCLRVLTVTTMNVPAMLI